MHSGTRAQRHEKLHDSLVLSFRRTHQRRLSHRISRVYVRSQFQQRSRNDIESAARCNVQRCGLVRSHGAVDVSAGTHQQTHDHVAVARRRDVQRRSSTRDVQARANWCNVLILLFAIAVALARILRLWWRFWHIFRSLERCPAVDERPRGIHLTAVCRQVQWRETLRVRRSHACLVLTEHSDHLLIAECCRTVQRRRFDVVTHVDVALFLLEQVAQHVESVVARSRKSSVCSPVERRRRGCVHGTAIISVQGLGCGVVVCGGGDDREVQARHPECSWRFVSPLQRGSRLFARLDVV